MRKVFLPFLLVVAFAVLIAGLFVVPEYGSDTTIYECSGMATNVKFPKEPAQLTLFVKVTENRWWAFKPLNGMLRFEDASGHIPIIADDPNPDRWFLTGSGKAPAPLFPGLLSSDGNRENLWAIRRVDTFLNLYRWPKAGETVDMTKASDGLFSTIFNSLRLKINDDVTFNGSCKPKNN